MQHLIVEKMKSERDHEAPELIQEVGEDDENFSESQLSSEADMEQ